jgi:predicted membrane protein
MPLTPPSTPRLDRAALRDRMHSASYRGRTATPQLIIGVFIMIAGLLLTADRLDLFDFTGVLRFWPVPIIGMGLGMLVNRTDSQGRFWGSVWLLLGTWLLLNSLGIVRVGIGQVFWPLVLVFIGVKLVTHAMRHEVNPGTAGSGASLFAVMGESKRISNENPFKGGQMSAFMGGCQMDLRQAVIPGGGEAVIDVFSIMGGLEVWVPSNWTVVSQIVPVMGSVDDKRLPMPPPQVPATDTPPRLVLRGQIVMSGLTIKN